MNDTALIDYCDRHCKTPKALFAAWRVNRMTALAGFPPGYERDLPDNGFYQMHERMQLLVDHARLRMAVPPGGLDIKPGRAYRGCDGEVRYVVAMHPHHRDGGLTWNCEPVSENNFFAPGAETERLASGKPFGYTRQPEFKHWAIAEVKA